MKMHPGRQALRDVYFSVSENEIFGFLGPNGGGKSTLFRVLATYFPPQSGRVTAFGLNLAFQAAAIRRRLGVIFQNPGLDPKLSLRENLMHQGHLYGLRGRYLSSKINELLERYGLAERRDDLVQTLSGGLKRRTELAKGLLHDPELILMDEPSTGLDPAARRDLWRHLDDIRKSRRATVLLTTHLMEEADRCERLVILDKGSVAAQGTPAELKAEIGGDVLTVSSEQPEALRQALHERLKIEASVADDLVRIERENAHAFIPQLVESFPGLIRSVNYSKPTLEDVFLHHTGRRFSGTEAP